MREYDLRSKGIGTYEFPPAGDSDSGTDFEYICLKDINFSGSVIEFRLSYAKCGKQMSKANFVFEKAFAFNSVAKVVKTAEAEYGESGALANMLYCTEFQSNWGSSPRSVLAMDTLMSYGKESLTNPKDVDVTHDMYLLKAMVVHFLRGRLYLKPHTMVGKTTRDSKDAKYTFCFETDEQNVLTIAAKIASKTPGDYVEVISTKYDTCRYLL